MRLKSLTTVLILASVLVIILSAASVPVQASLPALSDPPPAKQKSDPSFPSQSGSCMDVLQTAGGQAGVEGEISWSNSGDIFNEPGRVGCGIMYVLQRENFETTLTQLGLNEFSNIYETFPDGVCRYPDDVATDISYLFDFHGYYALMETFVDERTYPDENGGIVHQESKTISWYMDAGGETCAHLSVRTYTPNVEAYGHAQDPTPIAEVLLAAAESNLPLLPPVSDGSNPGADPVLPGENTDQQGETLSPEGDTPLQPENPSDADAGDSDNSLFGIPLPVVLGSFGIPIIGAAAGAVASAVMGVLGGVSSSKAGAAASGQKSSVPSDPTATDQVETQDQGTDSDKQTHDLEDVPEKQLPEEEPSTKTEETPGQEQEKSEDPDPASEITEETKHIEETPSDESSEEEKNRSQREKDKTPEKKKILPEKIKSVIADLEALNKELAKDNYYVVNPFQGEPTLIIHGVTITAFTLWDYTAGNFTGSKGLTCEGYVEQTKKKVLQILSKRIPGAELEEVIFYEHSTVKKNKGILDSFDSLVQDCHILHKVTLPDGSEWAIDFHQHNNGNGPLMRPWHEARKIWKDYMGSEFRERSRPKKIASPKTTGKK